MLAITGATGFVGRALRRAAERSGVPVRLIARRPEPGIIGVGDIGPGTAWRVALDGVSTVVHLAARVHHLRDEDADPLRAYRATNVEGTLVLARAAVAAGVRRLVFVSSVKVNGERTRPGRPFTADDSAAPLDPYGRSKHEAEQGLRGLAAAAGLEVVVVRPPLVYGPGVGANFRALVSLVRKGLPLPLGAIDNRRSLIAADNLADLLLCCTHHPDASGQTFLCSDGEDLSTPALLRLIAGSIGVPARLLSIPVPMLRGLGSLSGQSAVVGRLTESLQVDMAPTQARLAWRPPLSVTEAFAQAGARNWDRMP